MRAQLEKHIDNEKAPMLVMDPVMSATEVAMMQREFELEVCAADRVDVTHVRDFLNEHVVQKMDDVAQKETELGHAFEFVPVQPLFYMPHCPACLYEEFSTCFDVMIGNHLQESFVEALNFSRHDVRQQERGLQYEAFVDIGLRSTLLKDNEERSLVRRHVIAPKFSGS